MEHPASLLIALRTHWQAAVAVSVRQLQEVISAQNWLQFFLEFIVR